MLTFLQFLIEDDHHSDHVWYHGTARDFNEPSFKGAKYLKYPGKHGTGFYLTADPKVASGYADSRSQSKSRDYGKAKGIGPHVRPYRVLPHKTFDMEREHTPQEVHNLVHSISTATGQKIPRSVQKNLLDGQPKKGYHIHVNLRDMHPEKDANALLHHAGYDSVSAEHQGAKELIALHPRILKPHFSE